MTKTRNERSATLSLMSDSGSATLSTIRLNLRGATPSKVDGERKSREREREREK